MVAVTYSKLLKLAATAGPAAVPALVAASVAGHDRAAFGAHGGVGDRRCERQFLLRAGFGRAQRAGRIARLRYSVLGAQKLRPQPAENVIRDGLGVGNLLAPGPAAGPAIVVHSDCNISQFHPGVVR